MVREKLHSKPERFRKKVTKCALALVDRECSIEVRDELTEVEGKVTFVSCLCL